MTKHNTFPGEEQEMPKPDKLPEIKPPTDPQEPTVPVEDPQREPEEVPPGTVPAEDPPFNPGSIV